LLRITLKVISSIFRFFFCTLPDFQILSKQTIHQKDYLFPKIDSFCAPVSQMILRCVSDLVRECLAVVSIQHESIIHIVSRDVCVALNSLFLSVSHHPLQSVGLKPKHTWVRSSSSSSSSSGVQQQELSTSRVCRRCFSSRANSSALFSFSDG